MNVDSCKIDRKFLEVHELMLLCEGDCFDILDDVCKLVVDVSEDGVVLFFCSQESQLQEDVWSNNSSLPLVRFYSF